ncbi:putative pectinesterase 11 [Durio zibethinus]|uniref:Pectinesterase 11 n=1 Tax=Durio zibethinus TaxID=66656 RepID=A0A6P6ABG5_DURZI|nr:putative pectinesterase 11 [Durio zibethinus]
MIPKRFLQDRKRKGLVSPPETKQITCLNFEAWNLEFIYENAIKTYVGFNLGPERQPRPVLDQNQVRLKTFSTVGSIIIFQNTFGTAGEAVAIRVSGDRNAFYGCRILSWMMLESIIAATSTLKEPQISYVEMLPPFMKWRYHLHSLSTVNGSITGTAENRISPSENTGCKITGIVAALLRRLRGAYSLVVFALTYTSSVIVPQGWDDF